MMVTEQSNLDELRRQAALLDLTFDAVLVRDFATDVIQFWNRGAEELYGFGSGEAVGRVSHDLLQTLHPVPLAEARASLLDLGRWEGELTHTTRDGRHIVVASRWAVQWEGRRPVAILEINSDITERKRVEDALQRSESLYRTIVQTANEGIWLVDREGLTIYANDRMAHMLGHAPAEMAERTVMDCVAPGEEGLARQHLAYTLKGHTDQFEFRYRCRDGSDLPVLACTSPVRDASGEIVGALGMFTDISPQIALQHQKDDFLSAAAHDLKAPLTSMLGYTQLLLRRLDRGPVEPDQIRDGLVRIEQNAARMTSLIGELLDVSRLQEGQGLTLNLRRLDLVALVARCVAEQQEVLGPERVIWRPRVPALTGAWDGERLERVIANLLSNAAKYSPDDTHITVVVAEQDHAQGCCATVTVQDHGIGIPPDDLPHIFERFHRARNVGRDTLGTGIGLAGARQIVEQHGGRIEVESQEGAGSTFRVLLPLVSRLPESAPWLLLPAAPARPG